VFGANDYAKNFPKSVYTTDEAPILKANVGNGNLKKITHMQNKATRVDQVLAYEDQDGKFTYADGYSEATPNSTKMCKRDGTCPNGADDTTKTGSSDTTQPYGDAANQGAKPAGSQNGAEAAHSGGDGHGTTTTTTEEPFDIHL